METTIFVQKEALPIVRSGLEMKRKALEFNLRQYRQRLDSFSQTHHMTQEEFSKRFDAGELGDDKDWFEWDFVLDAFHETDRQLKLLDTVIL